MTTEARIGTVMKKATVKFVHLYRGNMAAEERSYAVIKMRLPPLELR